MEWISFDEKNPSTKDGTFKVKFEDGREENAYIDESWQRTALMIQGTGGLFWRAFSDMPTHWRSN